MKLNKIFKYGFIVACLFGNAAATQTFAPDDKTLFIGIRQWDANVQGINLGEAHCVDFMISGAPESVPANFHHLDVNDVGAYSQLTPDYNGPLAGKFSEFSIMNPGKFNTIIIDWMTYHHIHRDAAWADFSTLLSPSGELIVPVTRANLTGSISKQTAEELIEKNNLSTLFSTVDIYTYEDLPKDMRFDLLRRPGITDAALSMTPAIIIATKQPLEEEKTICATQVVKEISDPVQPVVPVITGKFDIEAYNQEKLKESYEACLRALARDYNRNQDVKPLSLLSSPLDVFLALNAKRYADATDENNVQSTNLLHTASNRQQHGEQVILLSENIERNRNAIEWIDSEFRWHRETEYRDFWSLQAIRDAYTKVSRYAEVATNPKRSAMYAEKDEVACKNANEYMKSGINEWLDQELIQKLVKKGFDWR